jgi:hypothetical protein
MDIAGAVYRSEKVFLVLNPIWGFGENMCHLVPLYPNWSPYWHREGYERRQLGFQFYFILLNVIFGGLRVTDAYTLK